MPKRYNTPHRSHVVKTRLTDEEYAELAQNGLRPMVSVKSEFLRQAIPAHYHTPRHSMCRQSMTSCSAAVGKLTAEYGRIGGNLNQIARTLNEWHSPYPQLWPGRYGRRSPTLPPSSMKS